jgi:hypothetical protein
MANEERVPIGINLCGRDGIQKDKSLQADDDSYSMYRQVAEKNVEDRAGKNIAQPMIMDENNTRTPREDRQQDRCGDEPHTDPFTGTAMTGMTLERIVALTDELGHLNELVMLHLEKNGGFTSPAAYFTIVTPVLDMLEVEIRFRYRAGTSRDQMKLIVQDWIDKEIASLRGRHPACAPSLDPENHQ